MCGASGGASFFSADMLNLFSFFKQQAADFRRDNKSRSADYLAGGAAALREAGDCLTAHKDVIDLEWVTNQLNEAYKESRQLRTLNKAFDESRRTFQSRSDLQAKEIVRLKEQLAQKTGQAAEQKTLRKQANSDLAGAVGSLKNRVKELEQQLLALGSQPMPMGGETTMLSTIAQLKAELDKEKGISRAGRHVTSLPKVLKGLKRVLAYEANTPEERLAYVARIVANSESVLAGREPEEWERPEATAGAAPTTTQKGGASE